MFLTPSLVCDSNFEAVPLTEIFWSVRLRRTGAGAAGRQRSCGLVSGLCGARGRNLGKVDGTGADAFDEGFRCRLRGFITGMDPLERAAVSSRRLFTPVRSILSRVQPGTQTLLTPDFPGYISRQLQSRSFPSGSLENAPQAVIFPLLVTGKKNKHPPGPRSPKTQLYSKTRD